MLSTMRGIDVDDLSVTGMGIYRAILKAGKDLAWFAEAKGWVTPQSDGSSRVSRYLRKAHSTKELLEDAKLLGCSAADFLPEEFFR